MTCLQQTDVKTKIRMRSGFLIHCVSKYIFFLVSRNSLSSHLSGFMFNFLLKFQRIFRCIKKVDCVTYNGQSKSSSSTILDFFSSTLGFFSSVLLQGQSWQTVFFSNYIALRDRNMQVRFFFEGGFEILRFEKCWCYIQPVFMKCILCAIYSPICKYI